MFKSNAFMRRLPGLGSGLQRLAKPYVRPFRKTNVRRRFKRRLKRRSKKRFYKKMQNIAEIKYSTARDIDLDLYTYKAATTRSCDGTIGSTTSFFIPLIGCVWPTQGTGKQQMVGNRIYIRRLHLIISLQADGSNWTQCPYRIVIFKSAYNKRDVSFQKAFYSGGFNYPELTAETAFYEHIGLEPTMGKMVWDKKAKIIEPSSFNTGWVWPTRMQRTLKKTIKINKAYEKETNQTYTGEDYIDFNHSEYYLGIIYPPSAFYTGYGYKQFKINVWFTFTDI